MKNLTLLNIFYTVLKEIPFICNKKTLR
ncbi:hypothetical protein CNEO4_380017 [Clostridium neonatale]|nr:hypothetical protein CNEO3_100060 [Clostridium neonatale]CAI3590203.1 hypothetical protein CNEO4_230081 [Clostridium neonatale]CAI3625792.1 hypothetical protein CNEO4_310060 [Clostridium neonatale]CAI3632099.1 hypothetical protein CNEO4_310060 [Clostridium neonatale]CAI3650295.1 hypothetical protein CNEO4_330060 [Clostridium neonatale]